MKKTPLILLSALLVLLIGAVAYLGAGASAAANRVAAVSLQSSSSQTVAPNTLQATASYTLHAAPDKATFTVGVRVYNADAKAAQEQCAQKAQALTQALRDKGLKDDALQTAEYSVQPEYDYSKSAQTLKGYTVTNTLSVTVNDLSALGEILGAAGQNGANEIYGIEYSIKNYDVLYNQALEQAVAATKEKAADMAKGAGVALSGILSIQEGANQSSPILYGNYATESATADGGATVPVQGGRLDITATATGLYQIK